MNALSRAASFLSAALLVLPAMTQAQSTVSNEHTPPQRAAAQLPPQHPAGPTVHADGSITFHFPLPGAKNVLLDLEGADPQPMTQGADGVWTLTTTPLQPEYYGSASPLMASLISIPAACSSSQTCSTSRTRSRFRDRSRWIGICRTSRTAWYIITSMHRRRSHGRALLRLHAARLLP